MQNDHILEKFNFGLRPTPKVHQGDQTQEFDLRSRLMCFIFIVPLSAREISVKKYWQMYFMMLYPSVNFKWNCCIPSKVIVPKPQFSRNLSKKRAITHFQTWPVFNDILPFCKVWMKLMHPFKSYQLESKGVTTRTKTPLPTTRSWSLCDNKHTTIKHLLTYRRINVVNRSYNMKTRDLS